MYTYVMMGRSPLCWNLLLLSAILLLGSAVGVRGGDQERWSSNVFSTDRRYAVLGPDKKQNLMWAVHTGELWEKMQRALNIDYPFEQNAPVRIRLMSDPPFYRVILQQRYVDGRLMQDLWMDEDLDIGDLYARRKIFQLFMNRCAIAHQPPSARTVSLANVPEWWAAGFSLITDPQLRQYCRKKAAQWGRHEVPTIQDCITGVAGTERLSRSVAAALVIDYLSEQGVANKWFTAVCKQAAQAEPLAIEDLLPLMGQIHDHAALEQNWMQWLTNAAFGAVELRPVNKQDFEEMEEVLQFRAMFDDEEGTVTVMRPIDLLQYLGRPELDQAVKPVLRKLERLSFETDKTLSSVIRAYSQWLEKVLRANPDTDFIQTNLGRELKRIQERYADVKELTANRIHFMDQMVINYGIDGPQKEAVKRYLDQLEERFPQHKQKPVIDN